MKKLSDDEEWKPIKGYEGYYAASTLGRICSIDRIIVGKTKTYVIKGKILKPKLSKKGYLEVSLTKDKKLKSFRVHRIIAETFIPNPNNYPIINHINENKVDNNVDNLEWCTNKYNTTFYYKTRIVVYQYKGTSLLKKWNSLTEAAESVQGTKDGIYHCCKGDLKTYKGFIWFSKIPTKEELKERNTNNKKVKVNLYSPELNLIKSFNSMTEAAKYANCNPSFISMCCSGIRKTINGNIWKKERV